MDNVVATRLWLTATLKHLDANENIDCNFSMRQIVNALNFEHPDIITRRDMLATLVSGQANLVIEEPCRISEQARLGYALSTRTDRSLVWGSLLFVCFDLSFAYVWSYFRRRRVCPVLPFGP